MKLFNFTIIKLTICLIIGILIGYYTTIQLNLILYVLGAGFLIFSISYFISRTQFIPTIWFGIMVYSFTVFMGVFIVNIHNQKNRPTHYTNNINLEHDSINVITFRIREVLKPSYYYNKYIVDILETNGRSVTGKLVLNTPKDSLNSLKVDDVYITKSVFQEIYPPLNPGQFNYKAYLEKQYIYHQLNISKKELLKIKSNMSTVFGIAHRIREHINLKLKTYPFKTDELAIINAILLGQRQDIDENVYKSYTNAGAVHILAISGLHIGIILLLLSTLLKPLEKFRKGLLIKTIILVLILWSFAVIAGLSASVTRAVTMFSIVAISMHLKRPTNIYNTLAISVFILLLFKPLFLFDVGFQLSYLAVIGIVSVDPYLYRLWIPKNWLLRKYWHTFTVTISAQLGIIPISIFYFNQFPGLFFISNLIIIPVLGLILGLGILVILLAILNILPDFIAVLFGKSISLMNSVVGWVSNQEAFLIKDISFTLLYVLGCYLFIVGLTRFLIKKNFYRLLFFLVSIIICQGIFIFNKFEIPRNVFLIFHKSRYSIIGKVKPNQLILYNNLDSIAKNKDRTVRDFLVETHISQLKEDTLRNVYQFQDKTILVIDSLGIYNLKKIHPDAVLIRNSPKINLIRVIDSLNPKIIIADGSNYKSYTNRWHKTCKQKNILFHYTGTQGAFILNN
jgi:competence protein ComEC